MFKRFIYILTGVIAFSGNVICEAQGDVDYQHRWLYKEIEKTWNIKNPVLQEVEIPDSMSGISSRHGKFFVVDGEHANCSSRYAYVGRVYTCRSGGCSSSSGPTVNTSFEYFDYFILYDANQSVKKVRIYNYEATHGHEITAKGWLKQFNGFSGSKTLKAEKDIDAISGATISVYAITDDINLKTELLHMITSCGNSKQFTALEENKD